ncbi:30S ribosomal protein S20, partial [Patescibacteria group bacterium]|nr:30S ribosomal protein S20 [Patescibacteria group bacterium]
MPILKQAIKRMKQDRVRYARNRHYSSDMKSMIKLISGYIKKGETDKATKILPKVVKAIDTAAKKNLIHKNNAAHKKSHVQKALNDIGSAKPKAEPKAKEKAK